MSINLPVSYGQRPLQPPPLPTVGNPSSYQPPDGSQFKTANPFSLKVTTALATSYADTEFRDALSLLDERDLPNSASTRRQLRLHLQKEVIESNGLIIAEFGKVSEQLRRVGATIAKLNRSYDEMKLHISAAHNATLGVVQDASSLMAQRCQVETKQHLLVALKKHFVLTEEELGVLTSTAEPVDDTFFVMLNTAKSLRHDSETLLGFENQALGLDIMEQVSKHINAAYEKLYRWIQREFKSLNLETPQMGVSIRRALRVLAERPSLFQSCLDLFAETREKILSDSFYTALTGSSLSGVQEQSLKPIELAAYDPVRYVGDMLAWIHSAAVSEREALEILFVSEGDGIAEGIKEGREMDIWHLTENDDAEGASFDPMKALSKLVDRDMSGAARILRQRVGQVIQTNEDVVIAYKLCNLLNFYRVTFTKLLYQEAVLVESLQGLESEASHQSRSLMRDYVASMQGEFQQKPLSLEAPEFLQEVFEQLAAVMKTYDTSLTSSGDREANFKAILAEAFEPVMSGCENMADTLDDPEKAIFSINYTNAAIAILSMFDFTQGQMNQLQTTVDQCAQRLIENQCRYFRRESGLDVILEALEPLSDKKEDLEKMRGLEAFQRASLELASRKLNNFLASNFMDAMENLRKLEDSRFARKLTEEAVERFCADFGRLEGMLAAIDELEMLGEHNTSFKEISSLRMIFPRTANEIRTLLS